MNEGKPETKASFKKMWKQSTMFWSNMCFKNVPGVLSMDEHNANLCGVFWLKGDFWEHFKDNTMKKWGKIDSNKKNQTTIYCLKLFSCKPFMSFSRPIKQTIQKMKEIRSNTFHNC